MMATTIINSMRVKPRSRDDILFPVFMSLMTKVIGCTYRAR